APPRARGLLRARPAARVRPPRGRPLLRPPARRQAPGLPGGEPQGPGRVAARGAGAREGARARRQGAQVRREDVTVRPLRVALFASPAFALPSLAALLRRHDLGTVAAQPDQPA